MQTSYIQTLLKSNALQISTLECEVVDALQSQSLFARGSRPHKYYRNRVTRNKKALAVLVEVQKAMKTTMKTRVTKLRIEREAESLSGYAGFEFNYDDKLTVQENRVKFDEVVSWFVHDNPELFA